jgi:hypothetical protein
MSRNRKGRSKRERDPHWWVPVLVAALAAIPSIAGCVGQMSAQ